MIKLTRLNSEPLALDPDLIERLDATPDTVVTMVDGRKHMVTEGPGEVIERARQRLAAVLASTRQIRTSAAPSEGEIVRCPARRAASDSTGLTTVHTTCRSTPRAR